MSVVSVTTDVWTFNRERTLRLLDAVEETGEAEAVLAWRPGPGRAHIGWQLAHIAITEELFATARLAEKSTEYEELFPRFRGGSTPDENVPSAATIREMLNTTRANLLETTGQLAESDLDTIPTMMAERGWTFRTALQVIAWHEPHHQGQAHITLNLWKAAHA